jgi:hypothetical protein
MVASVMTRVVMLVHRLGLMLPGLGNGHRRTRQRYHKQRSNERTDDTVCVP